MMRFLEFIRRPRLTILAVDDKSGFQQLVESLWIDGRYKGNIRIDRDTHFADAGERNCHAHVYGRRDRDKAIVAVRKNGTSSRALKGILHSDDADALRKRGFNIRPDNLVEFILFDGEPAQVLNEALG
jgi:hypothetical protein